MKIKTILITLAVGLMATIGHAQDAGSPPPEGGGPGHKPGGFHILPPRAAEQLNLTEDQKKQLADLEADVKAKIEQILTPDQLEKLKQMHPPRRPGGPGEGGHDGPGEGGPGGPHGGGPGPKPVAPPVTTGTSQ